MEKLVEKINICFENLRNQVCILELDGPVSVSTEDLLIDYKINKCFELELNFKNSNYVINLSEMYKNEIKEKEGILYLDGGNIFTIYIK